MAVFDWGVQLRADFVHDGFRNAVFNIGGKTKQRDPARDIEHTESTFWDYVLQCANADARIKSRFDGKIHFEIPEETEAFKPLPMLVATGNQSIGIVMDAGANITKELGAKNVVTFGMCLDPASSPTGIRRHPIYFDPSGERRLTIGLSQFGFDPAVIRAVHIVDVVENGTGVKTLWEMGDGRLYDPMRGRNVEPGEPVETKRINKIGGNYSSKKTASTLEDMLGKTLGDTMIVASAMPEFEGGIRNPYYGPPNGTWKMLHGGPVPEPPTSLVLKTGDPINAARAIFKNVPVILERYEGDRVTKRFDYYSNNSDIGQVLRGIPLSYTSIIRTATERYTTLIRKFAEATQIENGIPKLQGAHSRFVVGSDRGTSVLRGDAQLTMAGALFRRIQARLLQLQMIVVGYFERRRDYFTREIQAEPPAAAALMEQYNKDLGALKALCPQTDVILRDPRTKVMNPIIPITQTGDEGFQISDAVRIPNMEIRLLSAFHAIRNNADIRGTVYAQRFEAPMSTIVTEPLGIPALAPLGGDGASSEPISSREGELDDYANDVVSERVSRGGQRGGAVVEFNRGGAEMDSVLASTTPILKRFVEYYSNVLGGLEETREAPIQAIYSLLRSVDSPRIASPVLLERAAEELKHLDETGVLVLPREPLVSRGLPNSTQDSLIYNAFAMRMNALNTAGSDTLGFEYLERKFLDATKAPVGEVEPSPKGTGTKRGYEWTPTASPTGSPARKVAAAETPEKPAGGKYGGATPPRTKKRRSTHRLQKKPRK